MLARACSGLAPRLEYFPGLLAKGAAKTEAKFAELAGFQAEVEVLVDYANVVAGQNVSLQTAGFAGGGEFIAEADKTRADLDRRMIRHQARLNALAARSRGDAALIAGIETGISRAASAAAGGG